MYISRISDLDELALSVRDLNSRAYILEAINAYRAGALRSAIMSTWIAVAYDIISKIRELSEQANKEATNYIGNLEKAIQTNNLTSLQRIEAELLDKALDPYGFISRIEKQDLSRLQIDRHSCAHPAFVATGELFQPTSELVRTHIVHAILHLLRHMPVQGKEALDKIKRDMTQPSFPQDIDDVATFMNTRYLDKAREALIKSLVENLIKTILIKPEIELQGKEDIVLKVLICVSRRHRAIYEIQAPITLKKITEGLDDESLSSLFILIQNDNIIWDWITESTRIRIKNLVLNVKPRKNIGPWRGYEVFNLLDIPALRANLLQNFNQMSSSDQEFLISSNPRQEFADKAIELFGKASDFRNAERLGMSLILPMLPYFSSGNIISLITVSKENIQIWPAFEVKPILITVFDKTEEYFSITCQAWKELVERALRSHPKDDYYGYPELQQRLTDRGVDFYAHHDTLLAKYEQDDID